VDNLRQEFIGNRLNRKTALVKEQVQTQRLKQQQLILKQQQQQQQVTTVKQEAPSLDEEGKKAESAAAIPIPAKKSRKSVGDELPKKPLATIKSTDQKTKRYSSRVTCVTNCDLNFNRSDQVPDSLVLTVRPRVILVAREYRQ
jgi:transcription initiation factor TFIID subunit TAF12